MDIKYSLEKLLGKIASDFADENVLPQIVIPDDLNKGDFTSNIALRLGGKLGNPMDLGEKFIEEIRKDELYSSFSKVELAKPGFINFWVSHDQLVLEVEKALRGFNPEKKESSLILEFGDLNPFKEPHIGHVRIFAVGESLARLFEFNGNKVIRANYEGDVGLHVAKCIYGIQNSGVDIQSLENKSLEERAKFLGESYARGAKVFEENKEAKEKIISINNKVYAKDSSIAEIWEKGRSWSLEYFEELYKKLGVKYDKYYFESEIAEKGKEIVMSHPDVFEKDDGAYVFRGENFGLHTRVFVTSEGNPMYEAKDLALAHLKNSDFPNIEKSMILTANEQSEYFRVLLKALEQVDKKIAAKTSHLSLGFVNLKEGKMSSRTGEIVSANWLLTETKKSLKKGFKEVSDEVLEDLSIGAVKWSMLKFSRESNISFSIEESIDLAGNSGPYMQYTYARIGSLIEKSKISDFEANSVKSSSPDLIALARLLCQFEMVVKNASDTFSPNLLAQYLFHLAQNFNSFYEREKIIGSSQEEEILTVCLSIKNVIGKGLSLLGISTPEKI